MIVLSVGAHPDDIELGCSATLLRHKDIDDEVHLLVLTLGEGGHASPDVRKREAEEAANIMGADSIRFGGLSAYEMSMVRQHFVEVIERSIREVRPDRMYCHTMFDHHQNHVAAAKCSKIAGRDLREIYSFELPSTTHDFHPNVYVEVSAQMGGKLACVGAFGSQAEKYYMRTDYVKGLATTRAFQARLWDFENKRKFMAEAFHNERMIIGWSNENSGYPS